MSEVNISKILEYAPKGLKLYSPLFGEVSFIKVNGVNCIEVEIETGCVQRFHSDGKYWHYAESECTLFPSKECRDWNNWAEVFSYDPVAMGSCVMLSHGGPEMIISGSHYCKDGSNGLISASNYFNDWVMRFASPGETHQFMQSLQNDGLVYNPDTHIVEKIKPKAKHYAIAEFKPKQWVLARDWNEDTWQLDIFSNYKADSIKCWPFVCVGDAYKQCIPYEGNEHLIGTRNMPAEQYINW